MDRRYVYDDQARLLAWTSALVGIAQFREDAKAIGHEVDGQLRGVFVYDTFSPRSCHMHFASDGSKHWLTRDFLVFAFAYPFIQCDFPRVTGQISANNPASLKLALHMGAKVEGRLRQDGRDGEDLIVVGMLRGECRYLPHPSRVAGQAVAIAV